MVKRYEYLSSEPYPPSGNVIQGLKTIIAEQVNHFMEHGYIIVESAFTREQATEFTSEMWIRLGMDPNDKSTWTKERIHMPWLNRVKVSDFAPKVWFATLPDGTVQFIVTHQCHISYNRRGLQ
jgi:hypothetical protein